MRFSLTSLSNKIKKASSVVITPHNDTKFGQLLIKIIEVNMQFIAIYKNMEITWYRLV